MERLVGRVCSNIHAATLNALRLNGNQNVKDEHYRDEERYMPNRGRRPKMPRVQTWDEIKQGLGFNG